MPNASRNICWLIILGCWKNGQKRKQKRKQNAGEKKAGGKQDDVENVANRAGEGEHVAGISYMIKNLYSYNI